MLGLCFSGCSQDDDGDVDGASQGWRAASAVLADSSSEFQQSVELGSDGSVTASCPDGGNVSVQGRFDDDGTFEFDLAFEDCKSQGVTMNGGLSASASISVTGSSSEVRFDYTGHIEFTGAVELSCGIDVTGRIATSVSGGQASADAEFEGTICGVSADAAIHA